jgi:glyoxylase-like metal-dependent hydrolase (beta-lactamase superfamily II)
VSVISTGTVRIRPEHPYGSRKPMYWWLLTSRRWTPPRPINVYVIEHSSGLILFDTGQDRASVTSDTYFPGGVTGFMYNRLARFDIGEDDTLTAQLATLGYAPADVDTAIVSHLHQDHIGGLRELAGSELLVSAAEWAELAKPAPELRGFLRSHIELPGLKWHQVSLEPTRDPALAPFTEALDVMGDGSLTLLATSGHTAGSMSLLVRRAGRPPLLLAGTSPTEPTFSSAASCPASAAGGGSRKARTRSSPWPGSSRAWSCCPPTTRRPPSGCWTVSTVR